jgi:cell division control protein 6
MGNIILDKTPFDPTYLPKKLLHRNEQMNQLIRSFSTLLDTSPSGVKAILIGPSGSGKTSLSNMLTNWYRSAKPGGSGFVVNCRIEGSEYNVLMRTLIMARMAQGFLRGISIEEALISFIDSLEKVKQPLLVVLDNADALLMRERIYLMYALLRIHERSVKAGNNLGLLLTMRRIPNSIGTERLPDIAFLPTIKLSGYAEQELVDIIEDRAQMSLRPGSYDRSLISLIAHSAMPSGDARYAIEILARAATLSDSEGCDRVLTEDVRKALSILPSFPSESDLTSLGDTQRDVLASLSVSFSESNEAFAAMGKIEEDYRRYAEEKGKKPVSHTRLWEMLSDLEKTGFIKRSVKSFGKRGRTTVVFLIPPAVALRRMLEKDG